MASLFRAKKKDTIDAKILQFKFAIVAIGRAPGTVSIIKQEITRENAA